MIQSLGFATNLFARSNFAGLWWLMFILLCKKSISWSISKYFYVFVNLSHVWRRRKIFQYWQFESHSLILLVVMEPLLVIGFAYSSYISGELFHFSGIIALVCCGLIQAAYAWHNISKQSAITIKYMVKTMSSISDVIIFLFLGMVLVRNRHNWDTMFVICTLVCCIIYRFFSK